MATRTQRARFAALTLVSAAMLGACAYPEPQPYGPTYAPAPAVVQGSVARDSRYVADAGVVTSIDRMRPEERRVSPVGAIAGAVIGGFLGNQVGAGSGKAVATGAGVIGGALAGNELGRRAGEGNAPDVYRVGVRFDRGNVQYIDVTDPGRLRVGDRVRVDPNGQISEY